MKVNFTFRRMAALNEFENYGNDKILKLKKYEINFSWANIIVSKQRHLCCVEFNMVGKDVRMSAKAKSSDLYEAFDLAHAKIAKQMVKRKDIKQKHKHSERTKEYALEHFTDPFLNVEYDYYNKKGAA